MNIAEIVSNDRKVKMIINDDVKDMHIIKLATRCNILHSPPTFMIIIVLMSILKVMMRPRADHDESIHNGILYYKNKIFYAKTSFQEGSYSSLLLKQKG